MDLVSEFSPLHLQNSRERKRREEEPASSPGEAHIIHEEREIVTQKPEGKKKLKLSHRKVTGDIKIPCNYYERPTRPAGKTVDGLLITIQPEKLETLYSSSSKILSRRK
jgi:hypothetical protein